MQRLNPPKYPQEGYNPLVDIFFDHYVSSIEVILISS